MTTAARRHDLIVRAQQLEAELPLVEKTLLSQTSHTTAFCSPGVDWHSEVRIDENVVTRRDLPRFVMDSYEECRGPPQLFLLDKFDVAGAGLKHFSDPSFFKLEPADSSYTNSEAQREKKTRKTKPLLDQLLTRCNPTLPVIQPHDSPDDPSSGNAAAFAAQNRL